MSINYQDLTPTELRNLMANAQRLENVQVYGEALDWLCRMSPDADIGTADLSDRLTQRFWQAITAAEQVRTQANGKTTRLQRTRNKAAKQGIVKTMSDLALKSEPSDGFHYLVDAGLPHLVFEYVIAEMPNRFDSHVVEAATRRLEEYEIARPSQLSVND